MFRSKSSTISENEFSRGEGRQMKTFPANTSRENIQKPLTWQFLISNSRPFSSPQLLLQSADLNSYRRRASCKTKMDISEIAKKLGFSDSKLLIRKAAELRRLCDVHFDSSVIGVVSSFLFHYYFSTLKVS